MEEIQRSVVLNDVEYPLKGEVIWTRLPPFSAGILTGPAKAQDYAPTSKHFVENMKGGMGIDKFKSGTEDRYWYAENVDASRDTVVLGPYVQTLGTFGTTPEKIVWYAGRLWAIGNNAISYYDESTAAWVSAKTDLSAPTDAITFKEV